MPARPAFRRREMRTDVERGKPMSHTTTVEYGRKLIHAGVTGIREEHTRFDPEKAHALITHSAGEALEVALAGACLCVLPACVFARRSRAANALLFGALGSIAGFVAGFTWKTRDLSSALAHGALHEMGRVKDERWLENNPVDYA